jgi:hypothetical protein
MKLKKKLFFGVLSLVLIVPTGYGQNISSQQKAQMTYITSFEAGQPGASIYKLYDASDDVICYVLMPDSASRKLIEGKVIYDSNNLGSLSCVKAGLKSPVETVKTPSKKK